MEVAHDLLAQPLTLLHHRIRCPQRCERVRCHTKMVVLKSLQDMDMALDTIVPESLDWQHTDEGPE